MYSSTNCPAPYGGAEIPADINDFWRFSILPVDLVSRNLCEWTWLRQSSKCYVRGCMLLIPRSLLERHFEPKLWLLDLRLDFADDLAEFFES